MRIEALLGSLISIFLVSGASAHPLDLGYMPIQVTGNQLNISLELNPVAASRLAGLRETLMDDAAVKAQKNILFESTLGDVEVSSGKKLCPWSQAIVEYVSEQQIKISALAVCAPLNPEGVNLRFLFIAKAAETFQLIGKMQSGRGEHSFIADRKNDEVKVLSESKPEYGLLQFVKMGTEHIGATPNQWKDENGFHLPDGIDHILFLLALILGGGGLWQILKTATGFTLGHSITLALAALGLVQLPASIVEPAIAASIVFVACEALFLKKGKSRWKIAAVFGLIHGFGFASALRELQLDQNSVVKALIGFNVGVELGQAIIIIVILPLLYFLAKSSVFSKYFVKVAAFAIAVAGTYWFFIRIFSIS